METVVLLHGIFRTSRHMRRLANYLEQEGYAVLNLDYPSTKYPLEELIERVRKKLVILSEAKDLVKQVQDPSSASPPQDDESKIHLLGYSMGALIVRGLLAKYRPQNLGRVVLLAPPNGGSEIADILKDWWPYRTLYGPAGQQLGTKAVGKIRYLFDDSSSGLSSPLEGEQARTSPKDEVRVVGGKFSKNTPHASSIASDEARSQPLPLKGGAIEIGIIAGTRTVDPLCWLLIPGANDGKVSVESTKLAGMTDHLIVPHSHMYFPHADVVQRQTVHFLRHGRFDKR